MNKIEMTLVKQIHAEIDSAEDRLFQEAKNILSQISERNFISKAERLSKLGFISSEVVAVADKQKKALVKNSEVAEIISTYRSDYPFLKFLTIEEFERICNKYNLIFAPVSQYLKDVPEKNIQEIESAKPLKAEHEIPFSYKLEFKSFNYVPSEVIEFFKNTMFESLPSVINDSTLKELCPIKYDGYLYRSDTFVINKINKRGLFIAAPQSHFNLKGLKNAKDETTKKGWLHIERIKPEPKDPIVFRYIKGGIQVLSKWGDEAEDLSLVVEKLN